MKKSEENSNNSERPKGYRHRFDENGNRKDSEQLKKEAAEREEPAKLPRLKKPKQRFAKPRLAAAPVANPNPRLNKYVANAGIASRRAADELIKAGHVMVNDKVVVEMGYRVQAGDVIRYKGEIIEPETRQVYILMNKPKNTVTTVQDTHGRRTVMDILKDACDERIYPVGRLDMNTTGLLLFTNDGELAKRLSHPSYKVKKIYHVVLEREVEAQDLQKISQGLELEDGLAEVDKVSYVKGQPKNEVGVEIHIGKNRIVRRIFSHLGYEVIRLDRVYYAGLTKKDIPRGMYRFLEEAEIRMLKHFV